MIPTAATATEHPALSFPSRTMPFWNRFRRASPGILSRWTQTTQVLVYGFSEETGETSYQIGPYLMDDSDNPLVPEVQNGYYVLLDRQAEDGKTPGSDILGPWLLQLYLWPL